MARVLLVYGRDQSAFSAAGQLLESMGHEMVTFSTAKSESAERPFNHTIVDRLFSDVDAAVIILSPDEDVALKFSLATTAREGAVRPGLRPNVALEYGMAVAKLGSRAVEISFGFPHDAIPSDWMGLNPIVWTDAFSVYQELSAKLTLHNIHSIELDQQKLVHIAYAAPEPPFESARAPYTFIAYPFTLPQVHLEALPANEFKEYQDAGFRQRDVKPEASKIVWLAEGWVPYIHKDISVRRYVWPGVRQVAGDQDLRMWVMRKSS